MKNKILTITISVVLTTIVILTVGYFIFGLHKKPLQILSIDSPDKIYNAYVVENPSLDPPNQSLFISKKGLKEFRLVENLPEDIEHIKQIIWSPDSKTVIFLTNWHLIVTNVEKFNTKKISLNNDWWRWHNNKKTFISSNRIIEIKKINFINSDSLMYQTSEMLYPEKICVSNF